MSVGHLIEQRFSDNEKINVTDVQCDRLVMLLEFTVQKKNASLCEAYQNQKHIHDRETINILN